jgi:hypothetical protein
MNTIGGTPLSEERAERRADAIEYAMDREVDRMLDEMTLAEAWSSMDLDNAEVGDTTIGILLMDKLYELAACRLAEGGVA